MKRTKYIIWIFLIVFLFILANDLYSQNDCIIKFYTDGQQYGVADLDKFTVINPDGNGGILYLKEMENPEGNFGGIVSFRSSASNLMVWDQFGCQGTNGYSATPGYVLYSNFKGSYGKKLLKLRYSKYSESIVPIKIYINDIYQTEFIPINQGSWNTFTETSWLEITVPCISPIANAGQDRTCRKGNVINLDGSNSNIGNGDTLIFLWKSLDGLSLINDSTIKPSFFASKKGNYKFTLQVSNGCSASNLDTVIINVIDSIKPYANAGADQYIFEGDTVKLNSSRSFDYDGYLLNYLWEVPSLIHLNNTQDANPIFIAPNVNSDTCFLITLYVNNGRYSASSKVQIHVLNKTDLKNSVYYHSFQNWDDDVDRIKSYSNSFGGDNGIMNENSSNPQIFVSYDTITRSGYGRALKIHYKALDAWSGYVESFSGQWYSNISWFNLNDLFPDFIDPRFQNRRIDSLVFYYKLNATKSLFLRAELHDALGNVSINNFTLQPENKRWNRKSIAIKDFSGNFKHEFAKYIMFVFGKQNNADSYGEFYIDDMYLVENNYQKPKFTNRDEELFYLNEVNFRHMWNAVDPNSKLELDRHIWHDLISTDAVGFQLTSYVIAHKRGWINQEIIEKRVEQILTWLTDSCKHTSDLAEIQQNPLKYSTFRGNWAHFLDSKTYARKDIATEFSIYSNALLLSGVLTTQEYFIWNDKIKAKAEQLYKMTDWNLFFRNPDSLFFGWSPEKGLQKYYADWFTEELDLCSLLGISSPTSQFRLPVNIFKRGIYNKPFCKCKGYIYSAPSANFTYYFLQMYAKFDNTSKRYHNARNAFLADIQFSKKFLIQWGKHLFIFGQTACEGPDSAGNAWISNYHAYGIDNGCRFDKGNKPNGTIAVYGSGAGILFVPDEAINCLHYYYSELDDEFMSKYKYHFWSPIFGSPDAFHLSPDNSNDTLINRLNFRGPWISVPRFGIDIGPMIMNIDSYLSEKYGDQSIRDLFSKNELLKSNISSFEFDSIPEIEPLPSRPFIIGDTIAQYKEIKKYKVIKENDVIYNWKITDNNSVYGDSISIIWNTTGLKILIVTPFNSCGIGDSVTLNVTVTDNTSAGLLSDNFDFIIYPNPANNIITVENSDPKFQVSIYTLGGNLVIRSEADIKIIKLDLGRLPDGIYIVELKNSHRVYTKKLIKQ